MQDHEALEDAYGSFVLRTVSARYPYTLPGTVRIIACDCAGARDPARKEPRTRRDSSIYSFFVREIEQTARSTSCMDVEHQNKPTCLLENGIFA